MTERAVANPGDVHKLALAAETAGFSLELRAKRIGEAEEQTTWQGPNRRQYDELSADIRRKAAKLGKDLGDARRALARAAKHLDREIPLLRRDEQDVRREVGHGAPADIPHEVMEQLRTNAPPHDHPRWADLARKVFGRSASTVPPP
jgi:hypothetical protein